MSIRPMMTPGMIPPMNMRAIDMPVIQPKTIMSTLGGMTGPKLPAPADMAAVKPLPYPLLRISGAVMPPIAAMVAAPEPETLAKIMLAPTAVIAVPPRSHESNAAAKSTILREMPPLPMMAPARMNSGIAMYAKELIPSIKSLTIMNIGMVLPKYRPTVPAIPMAKAIGTPKSRAMINVVTVIWIIVPHLLLFLL